MVVPRIATAVLRNSVDSDRCGTKVPSRTWPQSGRAAKPDRMYRPSTSVSHFRMVANLR